MTSFQKKVYKAVSKIPKGQVLTYAQVAKAIGHPRAFRAVGSVLNKNPSWPKVPCHRVIKSNGEVGFWRGGSKRKTLLLKREGLVIRKGKVIL